MSQAVGPIVSAIGTMLGGIVGFVFQIVGAGISSTEAKIAARRRAVQAYNASLQDRYVVVRSGVSPRRFALGRVRIGGTAAYVATVGTKNEKLDRVVIACEGPIAGVAGMWLGESFLAAGDFASGQPQIGQYAAAARNAIRANETRTLDNAISFTLSHAPRSTSPGDLNVTFFAGGESGFETLTVASIAGTSVTLAAPYTGQVYVDYQYVPEDALFTVQWQLGGRQQLNSPWPGVTTPKWSTEHRLRGVAHWRAMCDWDETVFAQGEPTQSVLVDGALVHDPRRNLCPCWTLEGAAVGAPGTLPTGVNIAGLGTGMAREVVGFGSEDGVPYVDLRFSGVPSGAGVLQVRLPSYASAPTAASGEAWRARVYVRVTVGALSQFTAANLSLMSWNSVGTGTVEASAAINAATAALPLRDAEHLVSDTALVSGATRCSASVRLSYASGASIDITLRIGLPMLWKGTADPVAGSSNPALLAGWWMTMPRRDGGMGIPFEWLDWSSVMAAANVCDETISVKKLDGTGYENVKRYECHTVLSTEAAPADNLMTILGAMAGTRAFTAGKYRIWAGAHRVPTLTLTDRDVVVEDGIVVQPAVSATDAPPNVMHGRIADAAKGYVEAGVSPVINEAYIALDGAEEPDEVELPASTDARQAQYLMGVTLEQRRPRMAAELTVNATKGVNIAIGGSLMLDLDGYEDFDALTWEVRGRTNQFNGRYRLKLLQTRSTSWALDPDKFVPIEQPVPPDTSYLWDVDELDNFAADVAPATKLPDGSAVLRVRCTWDLHSQAYVRTSGKIELRWRDVASSAWAGPVVVEGSATSADITIGGPAKGRYVVQARAVNGLPAFSEWAQDVVDVDPANDLDGIDLRLTARALVLPADTSGNVTSFSAASTAVSVWRNGVDETGSWALSRTNSAGVGSTLSAGTLSVTSMAANTDAGYVDVTATRAGYPTQTARLSLGKARAGADGSSAFTATATANMVWSGGTATKVSGTAVWDASVRSDQAYPGGAGCAWVADTADKGLMVGLNSDPSTDSGYTSLDYALNLGGAGTLNIYEGGSSVGAFGTYAVGDVFAIIYNGETVTYYRNGTVLRSVAAAAGLLLYLDSSFLHVGGSVSNLTFYPQAARGSDARLLQITATSQVFQVSKSGGASPSSITFNANAQNLGGSPTFAVVAGTATLTGSGSSRSLAFGGLTTDTATIQVTQDGLTDTITVAKIREGGDAVVSLLSNEAIVLPATSAGVVTSYSGAVSSMSVFRGSVDDTANWSFSRVNGSGVTSSLVGNVLTVTAITSGTDASYVDITATRSGFPTQVKRLALTKAKAGSDGNDGDDGADAPLLTLSATSQIFTFDGDNGANPASQTISLTAVLANLAGTAAFTCTRFDSTGASLGTVTLGGAGTNTRTLTVAQFGAAAYANITATLSGRTDTVTVVRVRDGANSVVSDLTNDTHTLPADAGGNITSYNGANTRMVVYLGVNDDSANWAYSAVASTGVTASLGSGSNKNLLTVTGMTAAVESGYVDITATRAGFPAQTKRFSLSKSKSAPGTDGPTQTWTASASSEDLVSPYSMSATVTLQTDGQLSYTAIPGGSGLLPVGWFSRVQVGVGSSYKMRASLVSGVAPTGVTLDTWLPLSSSRSFTLAGSTNKDCRLSVVVADNTTGQVVGAGTIYLDNANGL